MHYPKIKSRTSFFGGVITLTFFALIFISYLWISSRENQIVSDSQNLTAKVIYDFIHHSDEQLSLALVNFGTDFNNMPEKKVKSIDSILSRISETFFHSRKGMEGGFYFPGADRFMGYSFPTSPPPIPAYGPPPRSYNIIRDQLLQSVIRKKVIIDMHKFDPAVFPLATGYVEISPGQFIGIWTRVHIERELAFFTLKDLLLIAGVLSILGFIIIVIVTLGVHWKLEKLKNDLELMKIDNSHRVSSENGIFGYINSFINDTLENLYEQNRKREHLEKELSQKEKMASLGKLIAGVAHEVKTPLAIIKPRLQYWKSKIDNDNNIVLSELINSESIQMIVNQIDRLSILVNKLLVFSKPAKNQIKQVNLSNLILEIIQTLQERYENQVVFSLKNDDSGDTVMADPNGLEQVLLNIIINSIEAANHQAHIEIETGHTNKESVISIKDDGPGIPQELAGKIFDPFFSTKDQGSGLGLSIAYEIISAHKGRIEFFPNQPTGTVFKLTLPGK